MKKAQISLWPDDPAVILRLLEVKLIAASFAAGIGFAALSPLAWSYMAARIEPVLNLSAVRTAVENTVPAKRNPQVAAGFAALAQSETQHVNVERTVASMNRQPRNLASASDSQRERPAELAIPLPIPRPPDIEELSKAITAFADHSAEANRSAIVQSATGETPLPNLHSRHLVGGR